MYNVKSILFVPRPFPQHRHFIALALFLLLNGFAWRQSLAIADIVISISCRPFLNLVVTVSFDGFSDRANNHAFSIKERSLPGLPVGQAHHIEDIALGRTWNKLAARHNLVCTVTHTFHQTLNTRHINEIKLKSIKI